MAKPYSKNEEKKNFKHKTAAIGRIDLLKKNTKDANLIVQLENIRREVCKIQ